MKGMGILLAFILAIMSEGATIDQCLAVIGVLGIAVVFFGVWLDKTSFGMGSAITMLIITAVLIYWRANTITEGLAYAGKVVMFFVVILDFMLSGESIKKERI